MGYSPWGHIESDMTEQLTFMYVNFVDCSNPVPHLRKEEIIDD